MPTDTKKLTLMQHITRPIINWMVETWWPEGMFYGLGSEDDPFARAAKKTGHRLPRVATLSMVKLAHEIEASSIEVELGNVTLRGQPVGNWRLVLSKEEVTTDDSH